MSRTCDVFFANLKIVDRSSSIIESLTAMKTKSDKTIKSNVVVSKVLSRTVLPQFNSFTKIFPGGNQFDLSRTLNSIFFSKIFIHDLHSVATTCLASKAAHIKATTPLPELRSRTVLPFSPIRFKSFPATRADPQVFHPVVLANP